jgi:hypothetical protein
METTKMTKKQIYRPRTKGTSSTGRIPIPRNEIGSPSSSVEQKRAESAPRTLAIAVSTLPRLSKGLNLQQLLPLRTNRQRKILDTSQLRLDKLDLPPLPHFLLLSPELPLI